jgi:hypothetical protein
VSKHLHHFPKDFYEKYPLSYKFPPKHSGKSIEINATNIATAANILSNNSTSAASASQTIIFSYVGNSDTLPAVSLNVPGKTFNIEMDENSDVTIDGRKMEVQKLEGSIKIFGIAQHNKKKVANLTQAAEKDE